MNDVILTRKMPSENRGVGSGGPGFLGPHIFLVGSQSMYRPPIFKAIQGFQFKLRGHMYMY